MTPMSGCPRCSTPVIAGARFCATCGADVSRLAGTVAVSTVTGPPSPPQRNALLEMLREATLGEYEVLGELGRGGMATVYLAHDISLDRKVAIKVISPSLLAGEGMVERFKREARTAASLSHPHIIPIYAVKETDRILYFVMKFVDGRPLDSIIREVGALPIPMAQAILHQAGGALAYAHRRGVVHRDVKPANIMVDEEGWAVVTDFGIAKISAAQALTMTGVTVGTPAYMSPEQCAAHPVTGASDQYSLAVVVYEMLTGRPPFAAESIMALMFAHFNEPVPPIKDGRSDCPPQLEAAVMRMLEKAPTHRWQDIEEAIAAAGGASLAQDESTRRSMTELARAGGTTEVLRRFSTPASPIPSMKASSVGAGRTMALLVSVSVSPSAKTLRVGQSVPLVATVRDAKGTPHPERPVSWASNAPGVATVSPGGLLSAVAPGSAIITATSEEVSGTTAVTVTAPAVQSVAAEAAPLPARGGRRIPMGTWVGVGVAAVAVAAGVWAATRGGGGRGPDQDAAPGAGSVVAGLSVSPAADSLVVGGQLQLDVAARDSNGAVLATRRVKWASSQPSVARVSPTGLVSGAAPGAAAITASVEGRSASASVTVRAAVGSVTLTPADTSLKAGEIILVQVAIRDAAGNALRGRPVRWSSSDDRVATVNALGLVTAVGAGRATITGASEGRSAGASVAVTPAPVQPGPPAAVATVTVVPNELSLVVGESAQLSAALRDARGAPLTGRSITWSAADPRIATVATNGTVTAVGDGTTRITAGSERKNATAIITVSAPVPPRAAPVASIDVTPDPGTLRMGETQQLRAIPRDATGASLAGRSVQWSSSQSGVVTVTTGGLVTAVGAGKATISASSEGQRIGVEVTVAAAPPPIDNSATEIAAVVREFVQALASRRMDRLRSVYPDMSAQQKQGWTGLLESRDVTDFTAVLSDQAAPTVYDSTASITFVVTLGFRTQASGRQTQTVPYLATLVRRSAGWHLQVLQERR